MTTTERRRRVDRIEVRRTNRTWSVYIDGEFVDGGFTRREIVDRFVEILRRDLRREPYRKERPP